MTDSDRTIIQAAEDYARECLGPLRASHGWDHVERVVRAARHLASIEQGADIVVVTLAALLHDIARPEETAAGGVGAACHAELGGELAARFLTEKGLDPERTAAVRHCIETHRFRTDRRPQTLEARIIYDADKLDSIGAVGIGRAFLFSGEVGARVHNPHIDVMLTDAYSHEDTAYREFMVKLRHVKDRMMTAEGRRMAADRHAFMELFFRQLEAEVKGDR